MRALRGSAGRLAVLASLGVAALEGWLAMAAAGDPPGGAMTVPTAVDFLPAAMSDEPITPIPQAPPADPLKVRLGERLFQDGRLSRDNLRSCSSCHDLKGNGATTRGRDTALDGSPLPFNTPTLFNAALNYRLGWEGRPGTLEQQAADSIKGPAMESSLAEVTAKLTADPQIDRLFRAAYGHGPDPASVTDALATFERSLRTPGGRFDRWLRGDTAALSARELDGYNLFKSLGCSACHQGVNVGGNLLERHGIFHPLARPDPVILRVPSLRNVAATAPYFHDGSAPTLQDAVRQMACAQLDDSLNQAQVEEIVAFLRTLSGRYQGRPIQDSQPPAQVAGRDGQDALPAQSSSGCSTGRCSVTVARWRSARWRPQLTRGGGPGHAPLRWLAASSASASPLTRKVVHSSRGTAPRLR